MANGSSIDHMAVGSGALETIFGPAPSLIFLWSFICAAVIAWGFFLMNGYGGSSEAGQRDRNERRKHEASKKAKSLLASEIALRDEFDEWLAAWELRLKIECAAHPDDQDRDGALAAVELAKRENATRIVALHQDGDTALAKPDGPEAVKRQWKDLEAKCAALRS